MPTEGLTPTGAAFAHPRAHKAKESLWEFTKKFFARFLFLWVVFGLFALDKTVILAQEHIDYSTQGIAALNALIMAKVLLLAEDFHFAERSKSDEPLLIPILWKAFAFSLLFIVVHIVEEILKGLLHHKSLMESLPTFGGVKVLLCITAILFISLAPYFAFHELGRIIGRTRLRHLLLKGGPAPRESEGAS